jgi:hypothetical protein
LKRLWHAVVVVIWVVYECFCGSSEEAGPNRC